MVAGSWSPYDCATFPIIVKSAVEKLLFELMSRFKDIVTGITIVAEIFEDAVADWDEAVMVDPININPSEMTLLMMCIPVI